MRKAVAELLRRGPLIVDCIHAAGDLVKAHYVGSCIVTLTNAERIAGIEVLIKRELCKFLRSSEHSVIDLSEESGKTGLKVSTEI